VKRSSTIHTADGSSVTITPRGIEYDLHVRDAAGRTVATVEMSADDYAALRADMEDEA
jgi:hypothetical protein